MRISDWSSDVGSSDLQPDFLRQFGRKNPPGAVEGNSTPVAWTSHAYFPPPGPGRKWIDRPADQSVSLGRLGSLRKGRSEERRVGKECVRTGRSRWTQYN